MEKSDTVTRLFERYNAYTRRPTVQDPRMRRVIFQSLNRILSSWLPPDPNASILDIGCGEGSLLAFLRERGYANLAGFDISPENVAICHQIGLHFVEQADALRLGERYPDERFDVIFALDLLEHLPKGRAASFLADARRCLHPGGFLIIQTPNMGCVFGYYCRFNDLSHEFGLTEKSARDLMMVAGFQDQDVEIRPSWNATTLLGFTREYYLRLIHRLIFLAEDSSRPRIPTKNLLIRARKA